MDESEELYRRIEGLQIVIEALLKRDALYDASSAASSAAYDLLKILRRWPRDLDIIRKYAYQLVDAPHKDAIFDDIRQLSIMYPENWTTE